MAPSAASVVPSVWKYAMGGGCWAVIACSSVRRNASSSALGSRCGSVLSVSDAMPTGTSGNARRRLSASTFARSSLLAPVARGREHRARDVEDEDRLRVGADALVPIPREDRLRRREPHENGHRHDCRGRRVADGAGLGQTQGRTHAPRPARDGDEGDEREQPEERDERREWRQEGQRPEADQ